MKYQIFVSTLTIGLTATAWAQDVTVKKGGTSVKVENGKVDIQALTVGGDDEPEAADAAEDTEAPAGMGEIDFLISGNARKVNHTCTAEKDDISISGNANHVSLKGPCRHVVVAGNANKVSVDSVAVLAVTGNANQVTWVAGPEGKDPQITQTGNANQVKKKKSKT